MNPSREDLARLESEVAKNPASEEAHERLLEALAAEPAWLNDPRRFDSIEWFLEHNPRHSICRTPFTRVDPNTAPVPYAKLKSRWLSLVSEAPADPDLVRGAAAFVHAEDPAEARRLLRSTLVEKPNDPELWLDLGRMSEDPRERLAALEKARENGETLANLLVWIATTSVQAQEYDKARTAAHELLQLVEMARSRFGDALDWQERGRELWKRVRDATASNTAARELSDAITDHAYRHHWAHTVLGLLALQDNDLDRAVHHLRTSAKSQNDFRLSSYGPSLDLVREVCAHGRWAEGLEYLEAWQRTWDDPRLSEWIAAVKDHELL